MGVREGLSNLPRNFNDGCYGCLTCPQVVFKATLRWVIVRTNKLPVLERYANWTGAEQAFIKQISLQRHPHGTCKTSEENANETDSAVDTARPTNVPDYLMLPSSVPSIQGGCSGYNRIP